MNTKVSESAIAPCVMVSLAVALATPALAQTTPGDQSGTPTQAGSGQSAAGVTQAPASTAASPQGTAAPPANRTPIQNAPTGSAGTAATGRRGAGDTSGDIIVTARRVEERLQDVPISITVFNQQQLTNRNVVQAQDLATYTPSLSSNTNFGSVNSSFAIRGFVQDIGTQPSVGVYFADVVSPRGASNNIPIGDGAGPGSFFDLQNVQVLKGPQGTLFGRNTTGGAVLLVPQKPTSKFEGYVEGSYGNYDLKRVQAVLNVPLNDRARLRVGVDHEDRDGYLKNNTGIGPKRFDDIGYTAARVSLVLDLTPDLENYTIASYLRSDTTGDLQRVIAANPDPGITNLIGQAATAQVATYGSNFYTVQNDLAIPSTKLTQWQVINTTTWRASDTLTVKNIASYAQLKEDLFSAIFGTRFDLSNTTISRALLHLPAGSYASFAQSDPVAGGNTANQSTFTDEFQLQGTSGRLNWQAGLYAELSDPLGRTGSQSPLLVNCSDVRTFSCTAPLSAFGVGLVSQTIGKVNFRNYGAYAQGTYSITDQLKFTGGFRYTWDRERDTAQLPNYTIGRNGGATFSGCANPTNPDGTRTVFPCTFEYEARSQKPTWLADVDFKPTEDILVYAKYARGYRAGGITAQVPPEIAVFKPEKVDAYEGGVKLQFRGAVRGTFNVAGFYNDFSNQQLQLGLTPPAGTANPTTAIINAGKSRIYGAEVESSITPFDGFTLDASYTYLNAKIRKITPAAANYGVFQSTSVAQAGDTPILSPRNKVSVTGTYVLPLDQSIGKVAFGATFTHVDHQLANYATFGRLGHRNLLNLNLNWNSVLGSQFDLSGFATNVTNRKYYTFVAGVYDAAGFETAQIGEPRMYGVRLRYRFGD